MGENILFPKQINEFIKNLTVNEILDYHVSKDLVYSVSNKYILKISCDVSRLEKEYNKDCWINDYIISPKPIIFIVEDNKAYYLREYLLGENLCLKKYLCNPLKLINLLVDAINKIHNVKVQDKKYIIDEGFDTLIHGDFCLPNILVNDNGVSGFIDLGDAGIGDPWRDYAWCIWSLEYNLNTKEYTHILLEKLGIEFDYEKFNKYIK